jgi:hypothetical protein
MEASQALYAAYIDCQGKSFQGEGKSEWMAWALDKFKFKTELTCISVVMPGTC